MDKISIALLGILGVFGFLSLFAWLLLCCPNMAHYLY